MLGFYLFICNNNWTSEGVGSHYEGYKYDTDKFRKHSACMFFHKSEFSSFALLVKKTSKTSYMHAYKFLLNLLFLIEKTSSIFIMGWLCKYIHNVSHSSLMCLMIGATSTEIVSLHLKF